MYFFSDDCEAAQMLQGCEVDVNNKSIVKLLHVSLAFRGLTPKSDALERTAQ